MAQIIKNEKNFKVIECTGQECREKIFGGLGICDSCCDGFEKAYYIAVLHSCYCPQCYAGWMAKAVNYPEDHRFETRAFKMMQKVFGISSTPTT